MQRDTENDGKNCERRRLDSSFIDVIVAFDFRCVVVTRQ